MAPPRIRHLGSSSISEEVPHQYYGATVSVFFFLTLKVLYFAKTHN
jgi:hypothetical protein